MNFNSLEDLYTHELKDLYSAEKQILEALTEMENGATHPELKEAFKTHRTETENQVNRLEAICKDLNVTPQGKACEGIKGILKEGKEILNSTTDPDVCDAGLISAAQRVEHYEMAAYGSVRNFANRLGYTEHAKKLQETLDEEGNTDHKLTAIAENNVNTDATETNIRA